jgi:structure-specific endonuclease subunit SLX1
MRTKQLVAGDRPIPAFYCCYLLRSNKHTSYYIGSTPNPARRLKQHNGEAKGGAKKTSINNNRPWEMTCIVAGFPSRFAALQFEWAWQHTHETRHIEKDVREARLELMKKKSKAKTTQSPSKRKQKPPMSLKARLENLHCLLGVKSFERWPLNITFFSLDVFKSWELYSSKMESPLRKGVLVQLILSDEMPPVSAAERTKYIPSAISNINVTYEACKPHVEKSRALLESRRPLSCATCRERLEHDRDLFLICPLDGCRAVSHLACLSRAFLEEENKGDAFIPVKGTCPGCRTKVSWITLIKELSLRLRGQEEVELLFKPKRQRKERVLGKSSQIIEEEAESEADELDDDWVFRVDEEDDMVSLEVKFSVNSNPG